MKLQIVFFRGFPLLVMLVLLLGVRPGYAQTRDPGLTADDALARLTKSMLTGGR
jgi:hypothetical protein